jgi:class 3 adenylate cyclase/tetratricopeptide (TPR) repeat protein
MKCPRCQAENDAGARFCEDCGARLDVACPSCGIPVTPGKKFCRSCGAAITTAPAARFANPESYTPKHLADKILTSKNGLEGERKQVTVLFADVKGSMELLAERDPEEARKILDPVLERMMEAVHRYEGTVNQVMGDGIMALFGAPLAHEDHAIRACYAALRMQQSVKKYAEGVRRSHGVEVQIRVGVNSGDVVVRSIGSDLRMDYTAVGQTTHLAARMEQLATPGTIRLTTDTLRFAEGFIEVKPLGPIPVRGLAAPIEVYEATGVGVLRTRLQVAARRGLTRFVGRDTEIEQLSRAQQLAAAGHGRVVAIVGEPGVGKSRLVYELTHSLRLQGWLVLESASVSYGRTTSYLPVIDLLKGYFKIHDQDDLRAIREKVTGKLLALDRALEPTLPALLALLDVPVDDASWQTLDAGERRRRTLDAVRRMLLREAREQPLLLIFEDLHWIDGETQALLDSLVDSLGSARLLLLVNYRPEYQHLWGSKTSYSQLRLDVLPTESAGELLNALLGNDPGLAPLKELLVKRGNPFVLEETVRTLVETKALAGEPGGYQLTQPVQAIQVPLTVQAMLAARIDRLAPEDKRLLHVASVVGRDVPVALLQTIADLPEEALRRGLEHLQDAEFVYETGLYPDLEYSFTHALTHDVTYGGLLQERRRELHARLVDAIETCCGDRLGEQIERLAHHAVRGELREKAVQYLAQAGGRALARSALADARLWHEQALGVLESLPESRAVLEQAFEIRMELQLVLSLLAEIRQSLERAREAAALASRLNDDRRRGRTFAAMAITYVLVSELDEALGAGTRALEIAERLDDLPLRIRARCSLEWVYYSLGEYARVIELATENLAAPPSGSIGFGSTAPTSVWDRCFLIVSLAQLGRFAEAAAHEPDVMRLAEETHNAFLIGLVHVAAGTRRLLEGDWAEARSLIEHGFSVLQTGNVVALFPFGVGSPAWVLAQFGEASEALNRFREGEHLLERLASSGAVGHRGGVYHSLGRACLLLGQLDEARRLANRAVESSPRQPGFAAHALHLLGDIATHPDGFDAESGETHYRKALALAEPRGMRPLIAHCHLGLGKLYRRTGKREQAQERLTTATTMYREMDMRFWLEKAAAEMRELA